ncbi:alkaline phosphatase [Phaeodactylibacter sp.]|uniref:alkaline phosphatase n=1 Tax=Phaeodactylibacter sp. TaxID=1940289 RepID=UPI0025E09284|nr:alkaline phosphatase [Phaeodactylibacter sp.]MCI4649300.1 alkaline phosphatase [Phaeodactylibacter sp.]MCI5092072.1 alkaline phosphatase [Phaeodactylibacter sp.]
MKKRQNINFAPIYYLGLWLALFTLLESCRVQQLPPPENATARNIIFLIGDGMGLGHISAALYANDNSLNLEQFTHIGFQKTYSANDLITDSAAGATAFACGVKTYNGAIGLTVDSAACETILEELQEQGYATGLIATATIVHATPAAFAAHQPIRVFYEEIAEDLAASGIDYLVGGGKRYFDRREKDERDLIREMEGKNYYVTNYLEHELKDLVPSPMSRFCYFAADKHPLTKAAGRDYLPRAISMGVSYLGRRSSAGFFLMAEGSMIDWGGHSNDGGLVIEETKDFDRAVKEALNFARRDGETLVIVTADHESGGMALNPGSSFESVNASFTTNGHTAAMVPVFAYGPGAELFEGIYENTEIYYKMRQALGLPEKTVAASK